MEHTDRPRPIPPDCPARQFATDTPIDAARLRFRLQTHDEGIGEGDVIVEGLDDMTFASGTFYADEASKSPQDLHTRVIAVDRGSVEDQAIRETAEDPYKTNQVRSALLQRLADCHGIVQDEDGDPTCWALSGPGLQAAIDEAREQD